MKPFAPAADMLFAKREVFDQIQFLKDLRMHGIKSDLPLKKKIRHSIVLTKRIHELKKK